MRGQSRPVDVVVVDNGSSDGSVELVRERFPEAQLLELGANLGFGPALNRGVAAHPGADPVILLNDDVAPEPVDSAASAPDPLGPTGGAALYRRAALEAVGGFDERIFLYYEDLDLALRLAAAALCTGQLLGDHAITGLAGRLRGWRAARRLEQRDADGAGASAPSSIADSQLNILQSSSYHCCKSPGKFFASSYICHTSQESPIASSKLGSGPLARFSSRARRHAERRKPLAKHPTARCFSTSTETPGAQLNSAQN